MIQNTQVILECITRTHGIRMAKRILRELSTGVTSGHRWAIKGEYLVVN